MTQSAPIAIIGGSGFYDLRDVEQPRHQIVRTPYGEPSSPLLFGLLNNTPVLFLARHGQGHTIPPHEVNYRANLYALAEQGVRAVVAIAAVGAIDSKIKDGDLVVCDQILDYTSDRAATYVESGQPVVHVDFTEPYCQTGRRIVIESARSNGIMVHESATYAATQGPRFESRAEIDRYDRDGAHVVGMTGMPEAVLARELSLSYTNIALSVNPAAGRGPKSDDGEAAQIDLQQIKKTLSDGMVVVRRLLTHAVPVLATAFRE